MAYLKTCGAMLIWLTAWSLTTPFYGPIVATAVLGIVWLYVQAVIGTRRRVTTRPWPRRQFVRLISTPGYGTRGTRFQGRGPRNGNGAWMGR